MLPTDDQIRRLAYQIWQIKGEGHGHDQLDWFEARDDLTLAMNYELIVQRRLVLTRKAYVPIRSRPELTCRYCGKRPPDATFRQRAHAIPEFLGNRSLLSRDECDQCNYFFGCTIEAECAQFTAPMRSFTALRGKRRVPAYKSQNQYVRMNFDAAKQMFDIYDGGPQRAFEYDPVNQEIHATIDCQPYVPLAVLKCFTKMALAVMPEEELSNLPYAPAWILHPDHRLHSQRFRTWRCAIYLLPLAFRCPWVALWRRHTQDVPLPYMLLVICTGRLLFQIPVPKCTQDDRFNGQSLMVPRAGHVLFPTYLIGCDRLTVRLDSPEVQRDATYLATIKIAEPPPVNSLLLSQGVHQGLE